MSKIYVIKYSDPYGNSYCGDDPDTDYSGYPTIWDNLKAFSTRDAAEKHIAKIAGTSGKDGRVYSSKTEYRIEELDLD